MSKPNVREKIIEAAMDLFHEGGFNATGVQDIVNAAGVPKGSFYNHFESKDALALAVLDRYLAATDTASLRDTTLEPVERIRHHFEELAMIADQHHFTRGCLVGNFATELSSQCIDMKHRLDSGFAGWCDRLAAVLTEARPDGGGVPASTRAVALIHAWEGAIMHSKVTGSRAPLDIFFSTALPAFA
ncbi:MAG: TetR family transcriptional regulator C-terminal domain-containing protein [Rhodospirillales bacterium]